jgi:hypothetical protein
LYEYQFLWILSARDYPFAHVLVTSSLPMQSRSFLVQ